MIVSIVIIILAIVILILNNVLIGSTLHNAILDQTELKEENWEMWASFPGKSNVSVFRDHYFYDIENLDDVIFSNKKAIANEKGPYTAEEITEYINRQYSPDNTTVTYNQFRYFRNTKEQDKKQEDHVKSLNLVSMGVWNLAKNAPREQVTLKALYTIVKTSFNPDIKYGYMLEFVKRSLGDNKLGFLDVFTYMDKEQKEKIAFDPEYGLHL